MNLSDDPPQTSPSVPDAPLRGTQPEATIDTAHRHAAFGWWMLLVYLTLGIVLEGLHAFKIGWYLNVGNEARQLMLRLAHAHGTLLAVTNVVFSCALSVGSLRPGRQLASASMLLQLATILLPGGFLLGGFFIHDGDPGLGVWLVPIGAFLLLCAVLVIACSVAKPRSRA